MQGEIQSLFITCLQKGMLNHIQMKTALYSV